jgi:hypothetical protein
MSLAGKTPFISGGSRGIRLLRQRNQTLEAMGALFPGHVWTAFPDGSPEYLSQSIREYTGIQVSKNCANYDDVTTPTTSQQTNTTGRRWPQAGTLANSNSGFAAQTASTDGSCAGRGPSEV